ncbi:MAG: hypothetical protein J6J36_00685 [Clostridia bacterium]|nr:hypothetical protein [Clostridia bacterium]
MDKELSKKCCMNCRHGGLFVHCDKLKSMPEYAELCSEEIQKVSNWLENSTKKHNLMRGICCDDFENAWLEYPIAVKEIKTDKFDYNKGFCHKMGSLVKIKPCGEEYQNKTYLGFYIGDMPTQIYSSYNPNTNILEVKKDGNPAIFVPELKKIIFGYESWWGEIESEKELKEITEDDINNVWYVKLLHKLCETKEGT